jgi:hypothetical protein
MFKKLVIVKKSIGNSKFVIPPCVGRVTVEAYGSSSLQQCGIPLSGAAGTTATVCSKTYCLSVFNGGNYARSTIQVSAATVLYTSGSAVTYIAGTWWANTASNAAPSTSTQGVMAYNGNTLGSGIGQLTFSGGRNGRKYLKNYLFLDCGKCNSYFYYGFVFGGYGGQAGPNGPGGNGSSAYTTGSYVSSTTYNTGAGGGSNGGTNAAQGTPGVSRWGKSATGIGSGGVPQGLSYNYTIGYTGTIDQTVDFFPSCGPQGGTGGIYTCAYCSPCNGILCTQPNQSNGMLVITGYQNTRASAAGTYRYIFTSCSGITSPVFFNCVSITNAKTYSMCIPIGTTSTEVRVLGGGASGNINCGYYTTSTSYPSAGGGGGGYARSTYTATVTATGVTLNIQVACRYQGGAYTYNNSAVTIKGVLEARAYSASGSRGGGAAGGFGTNYARNGVTNIGGFGGQGYYDGGVNYTSGGGGGGAAWEGGVGGNGGGSGGVVCIRMYGAGGGSAATCSAAGGNAASSVLTSTPGGQTAGQGGGGVYVCGRAGGSGVNGGGGGGGGYCGGGGSTRLLYNSTNTYAANVIQIAPADPYFGPGGAGGGGRNYGGVGGAYGGGGGGGNPELVSSGGLGGVGLVVVTFRICGTLAASYFNSTASNTISQSAVIS